MVLRCIFIKTTVDVCKKSPPPYGAKNQHVNITKDVCKKSPPESQGRLSDVAKIGREADFGSSETVRWLPQLDFPKTL